MKYLHGHLRIESGVATTYEQFASDMIELSNRLGISVVCDVNELGVDMWATAGMKPSAVVAIWKDSVAAMEKGKKK